MEQCEKVELLMSRALDGAADEAELRALHAHLEQCPACRRLWEELALLGDTLAPPAPPEGLEEKIMASVRREAAVRNRPKKLRRWSWGLCAAACLAVAVLAWPRVTSAPRTAAAPLSGTNTAFTEGTAPQAEEPDQETGVPQEAAGTEPQADAESGALPQAKETSAPAGMEDGGGSLEPESGALDHIGALLSQFPLVPDLFSQVQTVYLEQADGSRAALSEPERLLAILAPDEDLEETALPEGAAELLFRLEQQDGTFLRAEVWKLDTGVLAVRLTQENSLLRCYTCAPESVSDLETYLARAGV